MKTRNLIIIVAGLLMSIVAYGQTFTANTPEGVTITFKITSTTDKTVQVGSGEWLRPAPAISKSTAGRLTVPAAVTYDDVAYHVTSIGNYAFYECRNLTNVVIPESITSIGSRAFERCTGLTFIAIPNSVMSLGGWVFEGCSKLKSVYIPSSVVEIDTGAFSDCSSISIIEVDKNNPVFDSRNNCNAIIRTKDNTLRSGCKNTIIPLDIASIDNYAFSGCSDLISLEIPNGVTYIGSNAFSRTNLTSITLPESVTNVGNNFAPDSVFYIICQGPPIKVGNEYYGRSVGCEPYVRIRVPEERIELYKAAEVWGEFKNIISLEAYDPLEKYVNFFAVPRLTLRLYDQNEMQLSTLAYILEKNELISEETKSKLSPTEQNRIKYELHSGYDRIYSAIHEFMDVAINVAGDLSEYSEEKVDEINLNEEYEYVKEHIASWIQEMAYQLEPYALNKDVITELKEYTNKQGNVQGSFLVETAILEDQLYKCDLPAEAKSNIQTLLDSLRHQLDETALLLAIEQNDLLEYCQARNDELAENIVRAYFMLLDDFDLKEVSQFINNIDVKIERLYDSLNSSITSILEMDKRLQMHEGELTEIQNQLKQTNWVILTVTDAQGNDVTKDVKIAWYDENDNQIGSNNTLGGVQDSTIVYYSITLGEELGRLYREVDREKVVVCDESIGYQLRPIDKVTLSGRVSTVDIDKSPANVRIKQKLNGKYEELLETQTDERGEFSITAFDDETEIVVSREDCKDAILHRDGFNGNGNIGVISLNLIPEYIVADIAYRKAVYAEEEEQETEWDGGLNNIEFTLTNKTKRTAITDFTFNNGFLIIKTGAEVGDVIQLVATSKQGVFADSGTTFTITEGRNSFHLILTELGGFDARCLASSNTSNAGYLYDINGEIVARANYIGDTFGMRHLKSGSYTLISMGRSSILSNIARISDLKAFGLSEGKDYIATTVQLRDGELTDLEVRDIPQLNEASFKYTNNRTYFSVDKSSVIIGDPITLSTHIDFNNSLIDKIDQISLMIELPAGCQLVENSLIANRQVVAYQLSENSLTMQLNKDQYQKQIRFSVIPTHPQTYTFTAISSFNIDGLKQQPIGSVQFEAKSVAMSFPEKTDTTIITLNGIAKGKSEVRIFDNDVFIGNTTAKADGSWTVECELYKPYNHSFHNIYAKILTADGLELTSETKLLEYKRVDIVPRMVTMLYYNQEYDIDYHIEYDLINGTTNPSWYYYFPFKNWPNWWETRETEPKDFTFVAEFTNNDSTQIKNVSIKVLNSDGTIRTLPATFDDKQKAWVATTKYDGSYKLPRNATVEYDYFPHYETEFDPSRVNDDNNQFINLIKNYITNVDTTKVEILDANESMMVCKYQTYTMDNPVYIRIANLDYDNWISELERQDFFIVENNEKMTYVRDSVINNKYINWIWTKEDKSLLKLELSNENDFDETTSYNNRKRKAPPATIIGGALDGTLTYFGIRDIINEYNQGYTNLQHWLSQYKNTTDNYFKLYNKTKQLLEAKCSDGTLRLSKQNYEWYSMYLGFYFNDANSMRDAFSMRLGWMERDLVKRRNTAVALNASLSILSLIAPGRGLGAVAADRFGTAVINRFGGSIRGWLLESLGDVIDSGIWNMAGTALNWLVDSWYTSDQLNAWYYPENKKIIQNYSDLQSHIKKSYKKCKTDDMDNGDWESSLHEQNEEYYDYSNENRLSFPANGIHEINDPSGYVYEAVTSNRLENVIVTCYQKMQNEEAVVWNAEDYSQENPLKTDATGFYRWDVPQGMWQVKYEKEGYETAYSDWLPVPPPQLDVNIGMKQSTPSTVKQMRGYESGITIETTKYMRPETMLTSNITVTRNGKNEKGRIEMMNEEKAPLGEETYVSKVKFIPQNRFSTSDIVVVTVHKEVESYCGVNMENDYVETVKIESEINSIAVDTMVMVPYQGIRSIQVQILPKEASAGKKLNVRTSSSMIASVSATDVAIDQEGVATLIIGGELPGGAVLDFSVDGTDVTATSKVQVKMKDDLVSSPTANIISGETVEKGTKVELYCETEGAVIYYTTDGSCPCDETTRKLYDGPIFINYSTTIKAMAVTPDMMESNVVEFRYTVNDDEDALEEISLNGVVQIYPLPVRDQLNVTANGEIIQNVTVSAMSGMVVASSTNPSAQVSLNVSTLPTGIYIINIVTKNGNYSRKILKVE